MPCESKQELLDEVGSDLLFPLSYCASSRDDQTVCETGSEPPQVTVWYVIENHDLPWAVNYRL